MVPSPAAFALEPKLDGIRLLAVGAGREVRCWTRHGTDVTAKLAFIHAELQAGLPDDSVVDGELVALDRGDAGQVGQDFNPRWWPAVPRWCLQLSRAGEEPCQRP